MELRDFGIKLTVPDRWNARFFQIVRPERAPATILLSTIPIRPDDSNHGTMTARQLGPDDILVSVSVYDSAPASTSRIERMDSFAPFVFRLSDFSGRRVQGMSPQMLTVFRALVSNGRLVEILAVFGSQNPSLTRIRAVSDSIATMEISQSTAKELRGNATEEDRTPIAL